MTHRDIVEKIVDAIRQKDSDAYANLFAQDAVLEHPLAAQPLQGRELFVMPTIRVPDET